MSNNLSLSKEHTHKVIKHMSETKNLKSIIERDVALSQMQTDYRQHIKEMNSILISAQHRLTMTYNCEVNIKDVEEAIK